MRLSASLLLLLGLAVAPVSAQTNPDQPPPEMMLPLPVGHYSAYEPSVDPFISIGWIMGADHGLRIGGGITGKRTIESSQAWLSGGLESIQTVSSWLLHETDDSRLSALVGSCVGGRWESYLGRGLAVSVDATLPSFNQGASRMVFGLGYYPTEGLAVRVACNPLRGLCDISLLVTDPAELPKTIVYLLWISGVLDSYLERARTGAAR